MNLLSIHMTKVKLKTAFNQAKLGQARFFSCSVKTQSSLMRVNVTTEPRERLTSEQMLNSRDLNSGPISLKFNALPTGLRPLHTRWPLSLG